MVDMRVFEIFRSIQGEGILTGLPTVFVRMAGCNLRCAWCDTEYARDPDSGEERTLDEVFGEVASFKTRDVCVTGGEPLLQEGTLALVEGLVTEGHRVTLETNGSLPVDKVLGLDDKKVIISMDVKCPSSGMSDRNLLENISKLRPGDQLKFIIEDGKDLDFAKKVLEEHRPDCHVIFQPVWGQDDMSWIADRVVKEGLAHHGVRVMVQLHKVLWGDRRGV